MAIVWTYPIGIPYCILIWVAAKGSPRRNCFAIDKQVVEPVRRVEIVTPARFRCIGDIGLLEFAHDAEHRI